MEWLLLALMMKHAVADLFVQSFRAPGNKGVLISRSNLLHSGDHGIGTFVVIVLFGYSFHVALLMAIIDLALHYIIDMSKTMFIRKMQWSRDGKLFWRLQALDQMLHYATYGFLIFLLDIFPLL